MKHTIEIDGEKCALDIRPMDESFTVYGKLWEAPLAREDPPGSLLAAFGICWAKRHG